MIVFINGVFGVGKSTVTELLNKKLDNCLIYDPEEVGYMLRKIYKPIDNPEDFQDLKAWRTLVVETAKALKDQYNKTLIIPMCIWNTEYYDEIIPRLKSIDKDFHHFCLVAKRETVINRLKERNDSNEVINWAIERLEKCLVAYESDKFEKKIDTNDKSPETITEEIINSLTTSNL